MLNLMNTRLRILYISCLILLLVVISVVFYSKFFAVALCVVFAILSFYFLSHFEKTSNNKLNDYLLTLNYRIKSAGETALKSLPFGIILYDRNGRVEWYNEFVQGMFKKKVLGQSVWDLFADTNERLLESKKSVVVSFNNNIYDLKHSAEERLLYISDITDKRLLEKRLEDDQVVVGFINLDNLDEAEQGLSEQEESQIQTSVYSAILRWSAEYDVSLKRLDTDKIFIIMFNKTLSKLIKSKFDILDTIRHMNKKSKVPITLSIGISSFGQSISELVKGAQSALDMALVRGGDQVAIRQGEKLVFLGGKTNTLEKRTRVKARMVSQTISNLVQESNRVIIMGHTNPDMDAFGAAIGMTRFAQINDCTPYIVMDEFNSSIERLGRAVEGNDYLKNYLISPELALSLADQEGTLLILVDTHRPSLAMEPKLLSKVDKVVVIDHHRRGEDFVHNAVLVYLEPYASSTCELVSELLQYQEGILAMDALEATALLAGIIVDTQNFAYRAGSRTFEAAAFLRRHGADLNMVQMLLKEDLQQYLKRSRLIESTIIIDGRIAVAVGDAEDTYDQLLIAQAADTLLNMQGVAASFVIALRRDSRVSISARSQGDINVQLIMERLGGGGHLTNAACQFKSRSIEEVKKDLLEIIDESPL